MRKLPVSQWKFPFDKRTDGKFRTVITKRIQRKSLNLRKCLCNAHQTKLTMDDAFEPSTLYQT